jgi:hypothetical protein
VNAPNVRASSVFPELHNVASRQPADTILKPPRLKPHVGYSQRRDDVPAFVRTTENRSGDPTPVLTVSLHRGGA